MLRASRTLRNDSETEISVLPFERDTPRRAGGTARHPVAWKCGTRLRYGTTADTTLIGGAR